MAIVAETLQSATGYLIHSSQPMAEDFGFDLPKAFDDRLASLRQRFRIPKPEQFSL